MFNPVEKGKIMFITFQGDYTCNPKYICEEVLKRDSLKDVKIIWSARKKTFKDKKAFPERIKKVHVNSYDFFKELASSEFWIANSVEFLKKPIKKRKKQIFIETWHGSLGLKRFDKDVNSGKTWVKAAELSGKYANYCVSNSKFETQLVYKGTFWNNPDTHILEFGHPRNDLFFPEFDKKRNEIYNAFCEKYKVKTGTKFILYAPTFRDSHSFDVYAINHEEVINAVKEKFGGEWKFLLRYHNTVRRLEGKKNKLFSKNIINVTKESDMQELIAITDIAITDYSSWIYDYILLKRPGFIFATDMSSYNCERGFYYPIDKTPFLIAENNDQLIENIKSFNNEVYERKICEFIADKGCVENGDASKQVVDLIEKIMEDRR
ncbi:CDP-glycerol glycerophosphotransferase family protein [Gallibacter sp. Marseille-QA0791]|uniref:CDP-glycerol glycerophosphotransferase family protein n=1 Tax=Gallibacter sp. Marseille-QA0791 TaxID=3378781 RepID=UPI003D0CA967